MCSAERPENYKIPDKYKPDEEEARRLQREELASLQYEQVRLVFFYYSYYPIQKGGSNYLSNEPCHSSLTFLIKKAVSN